MMSSLFSGVTGLRNHQVRMNVLGNNIANINTIGFKGSRATFQEALVQTINGAGRPSDISGGTNAVQLGLGMNVASIDNLFGQGGLETTGNVTDLAIQGNGFFVLKDANGASYFTRAGAFGFDANSYLVNPSNGLYVIGKMADASGVIPNSAVADRIGMPAGLQDPAKESTEMTISNNLNSAATESKAQPLSAGTTNVDTIFGTAVDGAGGTHEITVSGAQATFSTSTTAMGLGLTGTETLGALGITQAGLDDGTVISTDNGTTSTELVGMALSTTVNQLITSLNSISGISARLDSGEIVITREYAGDGAIRNISIDFGGGAPAGETLVETLFDASGSFAVDNGTNHSFTATDIFTPEGEASLAPTSLDIEVDTLNGLAVGVTGIGGGGITAESSSELAAGVFSLSTDLTQHATSISVYDSQGGKHTVVTTFTKTQTPNVWKWELSTTGEEIIRYGNTGTVTFNQNGSLQSFDYDGGVQGFAFDPNNGAESMVLDINAGTSGEFNGLTGFSSNFTAAAISQNGYSNGVLDSISIDSTGLLSGIFTNGVSRAIAQIMLASFNNMAGLMKQGESLYTSSANSGEAVIGIAGETVSASISSGALESSNVDLATEFTGMITAQRGYQANARVITTSDSMLDELVNLKR